MKKKVFTIMAAIYAIALVIGCSNETEEEPYPWKIEGNVLVKYEGNNEDVTIPAEVKEIGDGAFTDHTSLKSLTIHDGVTKIGPNAFWGCFIETVKYNGTLAQWLSMEDCGDLMIAATLMSTSDVYDMKYRPDLVIPNGVTSIPNGAFQGCQFKDVIIPDSVVSIGDFAFGCCSEITSLDIPDSVKNIGNYAFDRTGLIALDIPNGVTNIGDGVFNECPRLTNVKIPNSVTSIGNGVFRLCPKLVYVDISDGVPSIGNYAFQECTSLKIMKIPNGVTRIEDSTFDGCTSLESVTIPDSVTSIGYSAFYGCS
ncbi:MAG: leucine-rich repeat domain-containing protein, partial [Treponemataceae bacterium]|nr:leucine-rich repeat domain-containing protein [Treponemataceae bacterium]